MVRPIEEQLGPITELDEDGSGTVNANDANVQNVGGVTHTDQGASPGSNSFWVQSGAPTVPYFTDSTGTDIALNGGGLPNGGNHRDAVLKLRPNQLSFPRKVTTTTGTDYLVGMGPNTFASEQGIDSTGVAYGEDGYSWTVTNFASNFVTPLTFHDTFTGKTFAVRESSLDDGNLSYISEITSLSPPTISAEVALEDTGATQVSNCIQIAQSETNDGYAWIFANGPNIWVQYDCGSETVIAETSPTVSNVTSGYVDNDTAKYGDGFSRLYSTDSSGLSRWSLGNLSSKEASGYPTNFTGEIGGLSPDTANGHLYFFCRTTVDGTYHIVRTDFEPHLSNLISVSFATSSALIGDTVFIPGTNKIVVLWTDQNVSTPYGQESYITVLTDNGASITVDTTTTLPHAWGSAVPSSPIEKQDITLINGLVYFTTLGIYQSSNYPEYRPYILATADPSTGTVTAISESGIIEDWRSLATGDLTWDNLDLTTTQITATDGTTKLSFDAPSLNEFLLWDGSTVTSAAAQIPVPTLTLTSAADFDAAFSVVSNRYQVNSGVYWLAADNIDIGNRGFDCFGTVIFMGGGSAGNQAIGTGSDPRTTISSSFQTQMFRTNNATVQLHNFNMKCTTASGSNGMFASLGGGKFFVNNMSFIADDAAFGAVLTNLPEMYATNSYFYGGWNALTSGNAKFVNCTFEATITDNDFEVSTNSSTSLSFTSCHFRPASAIVIDGSPVGNPLSELTFDTCTFDRPSLNDATESFIEFTGSSDRWTSIKFNDCKVATSIGDSIFLDFTGQSNPSRHLSVKGTIVQHPAVSTFNFYSGITDPHIVDNWIFEDNFIHGSVGVVPFDSSENTPVLLLPAEVTSTPTTVDDPYGKHVHVRVDVVEEATINLPASPTTGSTLTIKDVSGDGYAITVSGNGNNIDGSSTFVIREPYGFVTLQYDSVEWLAVSKPQEASSVPSFESVVTTNTTITDVSIANHRVIPVDTSATGSNSPLTVNLPSTPFEGERITVKDYGDFSATNNITVGRNGNNIDNQASDDVIADDLLAVTYTWSGTLSTWIRI